MMTYEIRVGKEHVGFCLGKSWADALGRSHRDFGPASEVSPVYHDGQITTVDELVNAENNLTVQRLRRGT